MSKTSTDFPSIMWTTQLDDKFDIYVERVEPYKGELVIMDGDKEIYRKLVALSYDAKFGPDVADVDIWQNEILRFIDEEYNK